MRSEERTKGICWACLRKGRTLAHPQSSLAMCKDFEECGLFRESLEGSKLREAFFSR